MRAGLVQLCSSDDPAENLIVTEALVRAAAADGADLILTPECTNFISANRARQQNTLVPEETDPTLARLRKVAGELGRWLVIGSLSVATGDADGRFANRCFVIGPDGTVAARYDKIHMFDVALDVGETYHESAAFRPGERAMTIRAGKPLLGLSICYDMRFAALYRRLAQAGADILLMPAAFTVPTGAAHWHVLLRARAIETGCFVLAPAQWGEHASQDGQGRRTYGHSLAVAPWGEILADAGEAIGVTLVNLDLEEVAKARRRIPSLTHDRTFEDP